MSVTQGKLRLSINSDVGITNQIQTATNLDEPAWTTLTNLFVTQGSYSFDDLLDMAGAQRFYRIVGIPPARTPPTLPAGMVVIPAGTFQMGDTFNEGESYELPVHDVYVSAFYLDKYEVS